LGYPAQHRSASEMTYIVSSGALNSTHSLTAQHRELIESENRVYKHLETNTYERKKN